MTFQSDSLKEQLEFGLHGYAVVGIFSDKGFEKNLRVCVLVDKDIQDATLPPVPIPEGEDVLNSIGTLTLSLEEFKLSYTFEGIAFRSKSVIVSEHQHSYLLDFQYTHEVTPNEPKKAPHFKKNPVTVVDGSHAIGTPNLSGANVKLPNDKESKGLLGLEYLQGPMSATVLRLTSRRSSNSSWMKLLNEKNWLPASRLDWSFNVMTDTFVVSKTNTTKVYYAETYGPLNAFRFPPLEAYTEEARLPGMPLTTPLEAVRPTSPSRFALDKSKHSRGNESEEDDENVDDILETVTVVFKTGKYHHLPLVRTQGKKK